jgi:VWFA-related protein
VASAQPTALPAPQPAGIQAGQIAGPRPATETFRKKVEEVSLDLLVRGKDGKPVNDLQAADFIVTDNRVPMKLTRFRRVQGAPEAQHIVTLVFDRMDPAATKMARQMAGKILGEFPETGYAYAVLVMSGRLHLLQGYTTDHRLLNGAVGGATGDLAASALDEYTPAEKQVMSAAAQNDAQVSDLKESKRARVLLASMVESQKISRDEHTFPSISALQLLAQHQQQVSGRKIIIYFCQGLHVNNDSVDAVRSLMEQANRAEVSIVTVDVDFVNAQAGGEMAAAAAVATIGVTDFMTGASLASAHQSQGAAYMLGGRIVYIPGVTGGLPPAGAEPVPPGTLDQIARNMMKLEFQGVDAESPLAALAFATGGHTSRRRPA